MSKILLIAIAFVAAYWLLRNHQRRTGRRFDRDTRRQSAEPQAESMVGCAHCGVHLPRGEGIVSGSRYFCSAEHEREFRPEP